MAGKMRASEAPVAISEAALNDMVCFPGHVES